MDLTLLVIFIGIALNLLFSFVLFFLILKRSSNSETEKVEKQIELLKSDLLNKQLEYVSSLRDLLEKANRIVDERLTENRTTLDSRLKLFGEIENKLGQLSSQTEKIEQIGNNISSLSALLKPPKIRGAMGEVFLENLLNQILPGQLYKMQYAFRQGQRVDAAVFIGEQILPIDSKFPLDTFQRSLQDHDDEKLNKDFFKAVKKHIDDIAGKYICPDEGSTEFALMYIPSEAVYYKFVSENNGDGLDYALRKRVIPTSPGHIYGFLVSLISVMKEMGLNRIGKELTSGLRKLTESVDNIINYQNKIESSVRVISMNNEKTQKELKLMSNTIKKIEQPDFEETETDS